MTSSSSDSYDYDESQETYEDTYSDADKDETMPQLRQEEASPPPVRQLSSVPEQKVPFQKYSDSRQRYEDAVFKNDTLRKKYDLRNVDPKSINNIFLRSRIKQLRERTTPNVEIKPIDSTAQE